VGIFITFINIIGETGAFSAIVETASLLRKTSWCLRLSLPGYAVGVPAGAYVGTILTLILPIAVSLNIPLLAVGFITMGVGLGKPDEFCEYHDASSVIRF
jgi:hypothetical protein